MKEQEPKAISPEIAEIRYSIPKGTLANWRSLKQGPPFFRVNRRVLYRVSDFEEWLFSEPVKTIDSVK
jgi:hypothetical protein